MRAAFEMLSALLPAVSRRPALPLPKPWLGARELNRLQRMPGGPLLVFQGDRFVRHGHPFYDLYAVCSGLIEAAVTNAAGYRKVLGRYQPGDIIGLDALARGTYPADFVALEPSTLCAIPLTAADEYVTQALIPR